MKTMSVEWRQVEAAVGKLDDFVNEKLAAAGENDWDFTIKIGVRAILKEALGFPNKSGSFLDRI